MVALVATSRRKLGRVGWWSNDDVAIGTHDNREVFETDPAQNKRNKLAKAGRLCMQATS